MEPVDVSSVHARSVGVIPHHRRNEGPGRARDGDVDLEGPCARRGVDVDLVDHATPRKGTIVHPLDTPSPCGCICLIHADRKDAEASFR